MKKKILFFCGIVSILSLTGYTIIRDSHPKVSSKGSCFPLDDEVEAILNNKVYSDFFYSIGNRFLGVKKETLVKAKSITDFLPKEETNHVVTYKSVSVIIFNNAAYPEVGETGSNEKLTAAQQELLQSSDYSTNFYVRADFLEKDEFSGKLKESYFTPYLTIVPEKEARYIPGTDSFIEYLKTNNKENTANLDERKLKAAKLYFTVNKNGDITKVSLDSSSGYASIDEKIIELLHEAPGKWEPAENAKGEKVDQELVISFGIIGC